MSNAIRRTRVLLNVMWHLKSSIDQNPIMIISHLIVILEAKSALGGHKEDDS
jgi:hypothetical protein